MKLKWEIRFLVNAFNEQNGKVYQLVITGQ